MTGDDLTWRDIDCRFCHAEAGHNCRSRRTGKETHPHTVRIRDASPAGTLTEEELTASRIHAAQFHERTRVTVAVGYSCGCTDNPSEPVPMSEANVWPGSAILCDTHQEFAVVIRVTTRLLADPDTIRRILRAAGTDSLSADYVAADQNDDARRRRMRAGLTGEPT